MKTYIPSTNGFRVSDQIDIFPTKFKYPGASIEELILSALEKLQTTLEKDPSCPEKIQSAVDDVKLATRHLTEKTLPRQSQLPYGLPPDLVQTERVPDVTTEEPLEFAPSERVPVEPTIPITTTEAPMPDEIPVKI